MAKQYFQSNHYKSDIYYRVIKGLFPDPLKTPLVI